MIFRIKKCFVFFCCSFLLMACGSRTNLNKIWGNDEAADSLMAEAKSAYDQGNFDHAEKLATQLVARSPDHEEASVLLGYVYLSQGGLDPYRVASCLIEMSDSSVSSKVSKCGATTSATLSMVEEKVAEFVDTSYSEKNQNFQGDSSDSSDISGLMKKLQAGLLNLTQDDFKELQEGEFAASSEIFKTNPIIVPKKVDENLRNKVFILNKMAQVVKSICKFVNEDDDIKSDKDRYMALGCKLTDQPRVAPAKSHYLWAIAHLAEALVYESVILFDTSSAASSNFQAAADSLNNYSGDITKYVMAVTDLKNAMNSVFDTSDPSSMITACLNNLSSVNGAFAAIVGLPTGVRDQLSKIMAKIKDTAKSIGGAPTQNNQTKALKNQMTDKITQKVGAQTDEVTAKLIESKTGKKIDSNKITPAAVENLDEKGKDQIKTLCTAYDNLSKDMPSDKKAASKPKGCT